MDSHSYLSHRMAQIQVYDTKMVIRSLNNSKKDRQCNDQRKITKNDKQRSTKYQKIEQFERY